MVIDYGENWLPIYSKQVKLLHGFPAQYLCVRAQSIHKSAAQKRASGEKLWNSRVGSAEPH